MSSRTYGYLAEFVSSSALLGAIRGLRAEGYRAIDAYMPEANADVTRALGVGADRLALAVLLGGLLSGGGFYALEYLLAVVHYPHDIGGRPVFSWPTFIFPAVEMAILGAAVAGFAVMLVLDGLPKLRHPLFDVPTFDRASLDRYFLCVRAADHRFEAGGTRELLESFEPESLHEVDR